MRDLGNFEITDASQGAAFTVKIVPKANRTEIVGVLPDNTVKIRLTAPPVDGQENEELIDFLADLLNVPAHDIEIVAGLDSRKKLISVLHISAVQVDRILRDNATEDGVEDED